MNVREDCNIVNPFGGTSACSKFTIDDVTNPFILRNITVVKQHYTLSFYAKADAESILTIQGITINVSTTWERYILLFTAESTNLNFIFGTGVFYLYKPKLEIGNKATDWTPAPEDLATGEELEGVQDDLDNTKLDLKDARTLIEKNAEDIILRATVEEFNKLTKRVGEAELKLTAEGITSIVGTTFAKTTDVDKKFEDVSTTIQQTSKDLTVKIDDAAKTATNFLKYDGGLIVGEISKADTETLGNNVLITTTDVQIRYADTTLAKFGSDTIQLGLDSRTQVEISDSGFTIGTNGNIYASFGRNRIDLAILDRCGDISMLNDSFVISCNEHNGKIYSCIKTTNYLNIRSPKEVHVEAGSNYIIMTDMDYASSGESYFFIVAENELYISSKEANFSGTNVSIGAIKKLQLYGKGISSSWVKGRDNAVYRMARNNDGYLPAISIGTVNTSWEIGSYSQFGDDLVLANIDNVDYSNNNNIATRIIRVNINGIVTGLVGCNGNWSISNGALYVGSSVYNQGFIELYGATPFIDFHFNNSTQDFTSRIIETAEGTLRCEGNWTAGGHITAGGYLACSGRIKSQGTYDTTGTSAANMGIYSSYWTYRSTASSRRYKHDIEPLGEELNSEKLLNVPVHQYIYNLDYLGKEDQRYNAIVPGFIAEEVYDAYPIAADLSDDGQVDDWNHRMIIPPMLDLIQKLWKRINELESKIQAS